MRAIIIDPKEMTVAEADFHCFNYATICNALYAKFYDRMHCGGDVAAYVDDIGLKQRGQFFWHFVGSKVLMAGRALIVSLDRDCEPTSLAPFATLALTQEIVAFLGDANGAERAIEKGLIQRPRTEIHTVNGGALKSETIWQWDHNACLDEVKEGGAA